MEKQGRQGGREEGLKRWWDDPVSAIYGFRRLHF